MSDASGLALNAIVRSVRLKSPGKHQFGPELFTALQTMHASRKFWQRGSNSDIFFFERGERIQIALKADHHWPASKMPFKWGFAGRSMMAQH